MGRRHDSKMPLLYPDIGKKRKPATFSREEWETAVEIGRSIRGALAYLNITYSTFKKYTERIIVNEETKQTLFEKSKNPGGKGVPKLNYSRIPKSITGDDIVEGNYGEIKHPHPLALQAKLISEGYLKESCYQCGYDDRRIVDYKMPLLLNFLDGDSNNKKLDNLELLCYNCYFIYVGNLFRPNSVYNHPLMYASEKLKNQRGYSNLTHDDYKMP